MLFLPPEGACVVGADTVGAVVVGTTGAAWVVGRVAKTCIVTGSMSTFIGCPFIGTVRSTGALDPVACTKPADDTVGGSAGAIVFIPSG